MAQLANASDSESEDWGFKSLCGNKNIPDRV